MSLHYHVQRDSVASFKVGKTYPFGIQQNFFARDLFAVDVLVPVAGTEGLPIGYLLRDYFDPTSLNHYRQIKSKTLTADEKGLLKSALFVLDHQAKLLRELIFEQVRQESFPNKPSRLKGIWLIPHQQELLERWCATAPHGRFRAFEVEATGKFHHGAGKYLNPECFSAVELRENAQRYWSEAVNVLSEHAEILCEGEVKVLRELKMAGSKTSVWAKLKKLF
jgi:hypothetical protein